MKLYCMRHGEALPAIEDAQRPLSPKGMADIRKIAHQLKACDIHIDHIMHSPRLRARQTAELMAEGLGISHISVCQHGLDETDDISTILEDLNHWQDATLLVSHLPLLSRLIGALVSNDEQKPIINFAPGAIACLNQFEGPLWHLTWLLKPLIIPDLADNNAG